MSERKTAIEAEVRESTGSKESKERQEQTDHLEDNDSAPILLFSDLIKSGPMLPGVSSEKILFAKILIDILEKIRARHLLLRNISDSLTAKTLSLQELRTHFIRLYGFILQFEGKEATEAVLNNPKFIELIQTFFKEQIETYAQIETLLNLDTLTQENVDTAFVFLKNFEAKFRNPPIVFVSQPKESWEQVFISKIIQQLIECISPTLLKFTKKYLFQNPDETHLNLNLEKMIEEELSYFPNKVKQFIGQTAIEINKGELFLNQALLRKHDQKCTNETLRICEDNRKSLTPILLKIREGELSSIKSAQIVAQCSKHFFNYYGAMEPVFKQFKEIYTLFLKVSDQRDELIDIYQEGENLIARLCNVFKIPVSDKERRNKELGRCLAPQLLRMFGNVNQKIREMKGFIGTSSYTGTDLKIINDNLQALHELLNEIRITVESIEGIYDNPTVIVGRILAKRQPLSSPSSPSVDRGDSKGRFHATNEAGIESSSSVPKSKRQPKEPQFMPRMTAEEWNKQVAEKRELSAVQREKNLRELVVPTMSEINIKAIAKKALELSDGELKRREEYIVQTIRKTPNIQELFDKIYSLKFGHRDLEKLVHSLKTQGVQISLESPGGGSSHYTLVIGSMLGYVEKGGAFVLKDADFPLYIAQGILDTFERAGFTRAAVLSDVSLRA